MIDNAESVIAIIPNSNVKQVKDLIEQSQKNSKPKTISVNL